MTIENEIFSNSLFEEFVDFDSEIENTYSEISSEEEKNLINKKSETISTLFNSLDSYVSGKKPSRRERIPYGKKVLDKNKEKAIQFFDRVITDFIPVYEGEDIERYQNELQKVEKFVGDSLDDFYITFEELEVFLTILFDNELQGFNKNVMQRMLITLDHLGFDATRNSCLIKDYLYARKELKELEVKRFIPFSEGFTIFANNFDGDIDGFIKYYGD